MQKANGSRSVTGVVREAERVDPWLPWSMRNTTARAVENRIELKFFAADAVLRSMLRSICLAVFQHLAAILGRARSSASCCTC